MWGGLFLAIDQGDCTIAKIVNDHDEAANPCFAPGFANKGFLFSTLWSIINTNYSGRLEVSNEKGF